MFRPLTRRVFALIAFLVCLAPARAQQPAPATLPVVMLSDIHFDPFHDPAKFARLQSAPVAQWAAILSAPASPHQAAGFASLQNTCHAKGVDTDWALLQSALHAAQQRQPTPLFITVSGDLLAHKFQCRFQQLAPHLTDAAYTAFTIRTAAFVALQLRRAFAHIPIYIALGNNDSGCDDYHETPGSPFLTQVAQAVADSADPTSRSEILRDFPLQGDYDVALPSPMRNTRLIVLQDLFQSSRYQSCSGVNDPAPAQAQLAWLEQHLSQARQRGQRVWIMAHIPPGVDAWASRHIDVCAGRQPGMFLSSDGLADILAQYAGTIRLALFAHTHNDEFRLLKPSGFPLSLDGASEIPAKLVPSISPVHGNHPSFLIAKVSPTSATLVDYTVIAAASATPTARQWSREYTFSSAYHLPDFSAASVAQLAARLAMNKQGLSSDAGDFENWYSVGLGQTEGAALRRLWPAYACSLANDGAADFRQCLCTARPQ